MYLAWELGKDLEEVSSWSPDLIAEWVAFFAVKAKKEDRASKRGNN